MGTTLIEARDVSKRFGSLIALEGVSLDVKRGEIHGLLGDNGAGKSTLIKILSGVDTPTSGELLFEGELVRFASPRSARDRGVATVHQDLALIPLMSIARNFFLGREPSRGLGPVRVFDHALARRVAREKMWELGLRVRDPDQAAGALSGGERQILAISRAVHFGAKLLILDEPTAALGVAQTERVLEVIQVLRDRGLGIILITHNPRHAYAVGDRFTILDRGTSLGTYARDEVDVDRLQDLMAGGKT